LLAFGGDRLTADQVHHLLGTAGDERILSLSEAILDRDAKKALDLLDEAIATGLQVGELLDQLLGYWRDLMVVQCGGTEGRDFSVPARHHETLREHGKRVTLDGVLAGLDVLATTKARLRGSNHARTLMEMALVRLTRVHDLSSLSQLAQWLGQVRVDPRSAGPVAGAPPALGGSRLATPELVKKKPLTGGAELSEAAGGEVPALSEETWPWYWPQIVAAVGGMLSGELAKAGLPAISGPNALVFRFPAAYNQAREHVQNPERLRRVEEAIARLTGKPWTVRIERAASAETAVAATAASGPPPGRSRQAPKEEAKKVALVKRAVEMLGATIQGVDEGFGESAASEIRRSGGEEA
jgi:DNA polymerase-3 subunit gamma/tau